MRQVLKYYKFLLCFILIALNFSTTNAQTKRLDSLQNVYKAYKKTDTLKAKVLNEIGVLSIGVAPHLTMAITNELAVIGKKLNYPFANFSSYLLRANYYQSKLKIDSAEIFYLQALQYAKSISNKTFHANANGNYASILFIKGKQQQAIDIINETINFFKQAKDYAKQGQYMVNLANIYSVSGNRKLAMELALQALSLNEKYGTLNTIATNNFLLGNLFGLSSQYTEALKYHKGYAKTQLELNNWPNLCTAYMSVGNDFKQTKQLDSTYYYYSKALQIAQAYKLEAEENKLKLNLSILEKKLNVDESGIAELLKLKTYYENNNVTNELGSTLINLANKYTSASATYLQKNNLNKNDADSITLYYLNQALEKAIATNNYGLKEEAFRKLSAFYEKQNDYVNAYTIYKNYIAMRDSATSESKQLEIAKLNMQFSFNKTEDSFKLMQANTNAALQKQSFLNEQQKQNIVLQNKELLLNKQTILNSNQQVSLLNKNKELQRLQFLKTQAYLQLAQDSNIKKAQQLRLFQNEKMLVLSTVKTLEQKNENNILKRKQIIGYGLASVAALLFGIFTFYTRRQNKQKQINIKLAKEKAEQALLIAEQKIKETELQRNISDLTLVALRSQMNPHFIFNSLNSINSVVVQNNIPLASDYLTKFSKLIRLILDNSNHSLITLSKELETLKLYLLMENIRFNDKFDYSIHVSENLNLENIQIPPTTLQPFVENAILHGIMHLNTKGHLQIKIEKHTENILQISINDNGVGRIKAEELKSRTNKNTSHGYTITKERITKLHPQNSIQILDKVDDQLNAIGTTVIIKLHN